MNKVKGNKAIAELLGAIKDSPKSEWCTLNGVHYIEDELEFDEWEWLMPVTMFIEELYDKSFVVSNIGTVTKILKVNLHYPVVEEILTVTGHDKKQSYWNACVEFAEYYKNLKS